MKWAWYKYMAQLKIFILMWSTSRQWSKTKINQERTEIIRERERRWAYLEATKAGEWLGKGGDWNGEGRRGEWRDGPSKWREGLGEWREGRRRLCEREEEGILKDFQLWIFFLSFDSSIDVTMKKEKKKNWRDIQIFFFLMWVGIFFKLKYEVACHVRYF